MTRICIRHNMLASEDGVWLHKLDDVTEIVRRNQWVTSIERCPKCKQEVAKKMEFLRGDHGQERKKA